MKTQNKIFLIAATLFTVNYLGWFAQGNSIIDQETCGMLHNNNFGKAVMYRAVDTQTANMNARERLFKAGAVNGMETAIKNCYITGKK
ncbi:hypothetical protein VPHF99_0143 [Vibrio phage F99]|nr:hypothetical protein MYOV085v1_p0007 [Vibrio phage 355E48.1]